MTREPAKYEIATARWPEDTEQARTLLAHYGQYLAASPGGAAGICLAGYDAELRGLPGKYLQKDADLLMALVKVAGAEEGEGAGCVAVAQRVLTDGTRCAEMKRLWIEPRFRGLGLGRALVVRAIAWAQEQACSAVVLDTVDEAMPEAAALYRSLGFEETVRFNDNPVPGLRFYKLTLR